MKSSVDLSYNLKNGCWYKTGDEVKYTGELTEYGPDGKVVSKTKFNAGKIDGKTYTWYSNGQKKNR